MRTLARLYQLQNKMDAVGQVRRPPKRLNSTQYERQRPIQAATDTFKLVWRMWHLDRRKVPASLHRVHASAKLSSPRTCERMQLDKCTCGATLLTLWVEITRL